VLSVVEGLSSRHRSRLYLKRQAFYKGKTIRAWFSKLRCSTFNCISKVVKEEKTAKESLGFADENGLAVGMPWGRTYIQGAEELFENIYSSPEQGEHNAMAIFAPSLYYSSQFCTTCESLMASSLWRVKVMSCELKPSFLFQGTLNIPSDLNIPLNLRLHQPREEGTPAIVNGIHL
jgi:hypothetical protein